MDFNTSLRRAIKTGKVILGQNETKESINKGSAKLVVVAANCPSEFSSYLSGKDDVKTYTYEGSGVQLGRACGKPFIVSALAIEESGDSDILTLSR
ncbi:50S ribosomal protein L30e [Methanospirillum sp.]|uniref:50S ribosomal protein L30e n=1 Tax=Methanospirillum sp. TaxID=45200 RepID=UPI0029875F8D|nr:50S ribosomal protein L30e [Methanospirillum sp.]